MATIQKYAAQEGLQPDAGGMPRVNVDDSMAQALGALGNSIGNLGEVITKRRQQKEDFKVANDYRKLEIDLGEQLVQRQENIAPDGEGFHDDFMSHVYSPTRDKFLAGVPARLRPKYETLLGKGGADTAQWSVRSAGVERDQTYKWYTEELAASQEQLATAISMDPEGYDQLLQTGLDEIDNSGLPTIEKMKQRREWERLAQVSMLNRMLEADPEGVLKDLGADPRHLSPTTQYDMLEKAIIQQESGGDASAVSPKGAAGIMQVMPDTAKYIAKKLGDTNFDPRWNDHEIRGYLSNEKINRRYGNYYLKEQLRRFGQTGGLEAALIAYNGGPGRAEAWIKSGFDDSVLPAETRNYYKSIMANLPMMSGTGKGDPKSVQLVFDRGGKKPIEGQTEDALSPDLTQRLRTSFAAIGVDKIKINSGYRSKSDNKRVGGAQHSQHLKGNAVDIDVSGYSIQERIKIIHALSANGITGIGVYANTIHADVGGLRAWGRSHGSDSIPGWAKPAIDAHMARAARLPAGGVGLAGRFASLPYADRQTFISKADQVVTDRYNQVSKRTAVEKVQIKTAMDNELASIQATGASTGGVDDTSVSNVLGEDDYLKWMADKQKAFRIFGAKDGIAQMTLAEMDDRLQDYQPQPGSAAFAADQEVQAAVQKEIDRVTKLRSSNPSKASMAYPDVQEAYEKIDLSPGSGAPDPSDVREFVRLTLERQKEFGLKPGSEAPVPREWAVEIGRALSRAPELQGKNVEEVNASILTQYLALQEVFGEYTDEVILHSLAEYKGVGKNTAELITGYMEAIQAGGDPFKLSSAKDTADDRDQVESTAEPWFWERAFDYLAGSDAEPAPAGDPEPTEKPISQEVILRVIGSLNQAETPEDEAAIVARYGERAVEFAKRRMTATGE